MKTPGNGEMDWRERKKSKKIDADSRGRANPKPRADGVQGLAGLARGGVHQRGAAPGSIIWKKQRITKREVEVDGEDEYLWSNEREE